MKQFHLTQIGDPFIKQEKWGNQSWIKCQCDCGKICEKPYTAFKKGRCKTCSYKCKCRCKTDYSQILVPKEEWQVQPGQIFNSWTVIGDPYLKYRKRYSSQKKRYIKVHDQVVICRCICGKEKMVVCDSLIKNGSRSCGCKTDLYVKRYIQPKNNKKRCSRCKKIKKITYFDKNKRTKTGYNGECKFCKSISSFLANNPECNITREELVKFINNHDKKCEICFRTKENNIRLGIDHCHKTGKIRGILCNNCNTALGKYQDDINLLKNAIKYLEKQ